MKILISAYSCEPGRGSEPGIGWNIVREVAKYHEVWVLTRPDESSEAIAAELEKNPCPNLHFIYFTLPIFPGSWRWGNGAIHLHYYLWQIQAYFVAKKLQRQIGFDIVHHATFGRHSTPSFISLLPVPFIWGPIGGGETAPKPFWKDFSFRGRVYEISRDLLRRVGEIDPFVTFTARRSALALAATEETAQRLRLLGAKNVEIFSNAGLPKSDIARLSKFSQPDNNIIRFVSIGRLLHWKGLHLGLHAFALAGIDNAEYWIIGDGQERKSLEALAEELNIADKVKFWGILPREETLNKLEMCHALVHPSLHDSGGWVCAEMMAAGRPVICLDLGGPAVQVTKETGYKIPANTLEQSLDGLATAMVDLANHPETVQSMGKAGQARVSDVFDWEVKGKTLARFYNEVLNQQTESKLVDMDTANLSSNE